MVDLKSLVSTVKLMSDNVIVRITDDNATKNAMDELKRLLPTTAESSQKQFLTIQLWITAGQIQHLKP